MDRAIVFGWSGNIGERHPIWMEWIFLTGSLFGWNRDPGESSSLNGLVIHDICHRCILFGWIGDQGWTGDPGGR